MTVREVRKLFPYLESGKIYFNHAAIGPLSTVVTGRVQDYIKQRSITHIENYQAFIEMNNSAKRRISKLLNVPKDRIAWVDNVSNGINILARGLNWKIGDRIILNNLEFPSNVYPFLNLNEFGVKIDFAEAVGGKVDINDYEKLITPATRLISISLVQFLTGYRADLNALGKLCKEKGIIFCVDAIQGAGVVKIDAQKNNIDFLAGGTQKWLMGLQGASYIYVSENIQDKINQKYTGWLSVKDDWNLLDYNLELKDSASRYQNGTVNSIGIAAADASLSTLEEFGYENIENIVTSNTEYFINSISELGYEPILFNEDANHLAGITSVKFENADYIFEELKKKDIQAALREGVIRFSPHYYNTKEDIDIVVSELRDILKN